VLRGEGGTLIGQAPAALGPEYESRLLAHLDSINKALLKTSGQEQHEDEAVPR